MPTTGPSPPPEPELRLADQPTKSQLPLLQYAYKNKSTKNVSFVLQANDEQTTNVEMMDLQTAGTSNSSGAKPASPNNPVPHLTTAVQGRTRQTGVRQLQQTEQVQTNPTEDEMRNYEVPEVKAPVWRMYEHNLRLIGRNQARLNQINSDIEYDNLPSWCFGGTQAPQYMRPFHEDLITLTHHYAVRMAKTTRNILIRQIERDTAQARHLQETLVRMYKEDKDPNIDLAIGRAEGIAAHYTRKETILNARQSEEDQVNIPDTPEEWADILGRRKVVKQSTRSRSRSKSRDNQPQSSNQKAGRNNQGKQPRSNNNPPPSTSTYQPPTKKRSVNAKGQRKPKTATWTASSASTSQQGSRRAPPTMTVPSHTYANQPQVRNNAQRPEPQTDRQEGSGSNNGINRPTILNAEELRLISLLRASKHDN